MQHATAVYDLGALIGPKTKKIDKPGLYHGDTRLVLIFGEMVLEIMGCHCWPGTRFAGGEERFGDAVA